MQAEIQVNMQYSGDKGKEKSKTQTEWGVVIACRGQKEKQSHGRILELIYVREGEGERWSIVVPRPHLTGQGSLLAAGGPSRSQLGLRTASLWSA